MISCQCPDCTTTPAPTYTPEFRHDCEVRYVAAIPSRDRRVAYLLGPKGVAERRGAAAAQRIIDDLKESAP